MDDQEDLMLWRLLYDSFREDEKHEKHEKHEKIEKIMDKYWMDEDEAEEYLEENGDW